MCNRIFLVTCKVKICGIKRLEDALLAHTYGADAIGILVGQEHASSDFLPPQKAKEIIKGLPPFCTSVLVTHMADAASVISLLTIVAPSCVQLHGESTVNDIQKLRMEFPSLQIIKSIHVTSEESIADAKSYEDEVDAILLDTINMQTNQVGGTGKTHDWRISRKIVESCHVPVILAGGLSPNNVAEAIDTVRPYAVDVNSGTKGSDGFKDAEKLRSFIENVKEARQ